MRHNEWLIYDYFGQEVSQHHVYIRFITPTHHLHIHANHYLSITMYPINPTTPRSSMVHAFLDDGSISSLYFFC